MKEADAAIVITNNRSRANRLEIRSLHSKLDNSLKRQATVQGTYERIRTLKNTATKRCRILSCYLQSGNQRVSIVMVHGEWTLR